MDWASSWTWDPAPDYRPELHSAMPFDLKCVPVMRTVMTERGRILQDQTVAFLVGRNRQILQTHASWLQSVVDCAIQTVPGFHRDFAVEPHKIPDFPQIPPPEPGTYESLIWAGTVTAKPLTKTGKAPKFPLAASFTTYSDVLVRHDGFFVRVVNHPQQDADETIAHLEYLANGVIGKAAVHCWRRSVRWSVDAVTKDGQILIARIERGDPSGDAKRFYDYNA